MSSVIQILSRSIATIVTILSIPIISVKDFARVSAHQIAEEIEITSEAIEEVVKVFLKGYVRFV